ncbi:MAG: ATP-dependent metallopeptidase FtsH/Yme1/Tma family protein, partial [Nitrosomonadaceae bacterium]|nr:ATP-dependent metallopeptidase FtsH/Yme1/Tma family protein [Nitrosomonadaceae bacterium]
MENSIDKKTQINFWYVIIALVGILFVQSQYEKYSKVEPIPYSRFQALLEQGAIVEIAVTHDYIYGKFRGAGSDEGKDFVTKRVEPELADKLDRYNVTYTGVIPSTRFHDLLSWILPTAIFIAIWMYAIRRMGGGMSGGLMSIGKSRAKVFVEKEIKVTFADVAGVDEAKDELIEIVNFLQPRFSIRTESGRINGCE